MKKFTSYSFLVLFILSAFVSVAANGPKKNVVNLNPPFYSEDFASGIPAGWQNNDSAATLAVWKYTTTGNSTGMDALNSTTAVNGYAIFDSDEIFGTAGDAWLITGAINCLTKSSVHLTFEQFFKKDQDNAGAVYISSDGIIWDSLYSPSTALSNGGATANADAVDLDISLYADAQATVYIAFRYTGNSGYYWMVDDIGLYEALASAEDVGVSDILAPVTSCPKLSTTETVTIRVKNFGLGDIDSIPVFYSINGGPAVMDTLTDTIPAGGTKDFSFAMVADLSLLPAYTIHTGTTLVSDVDPSNDLDSTIIGSGPHLIPYTNGFETILDALGWATIDANNDTVTWEPSGIPNSGLASLAFNNDPPSKDGDDWAISPCISITNLTYSYVLKYYYGTIVTGTTDANLDVYLMSGQTLADTLMKIDSLVDISISSYQQSMASFIVPSQGNYHFGFHATHTANATTSTNVHIDDISIDFDVKTPTLASSGTAVVYPNPNNGTFAISNLKSFNGSVQVTVLDMMGRNVSTQTVNGLDKISMDLSTQAEGIYTVRISDNTQVLNKLITVTK